MKMSKACTGILFHENNAFEFSITAKTQTTRASRSRARGTGLFLQTNLPLTRSMNVKVAIELYYIFFKIPKFG